MILSAIKGLFSKEEELPVETMKAVYIKTLNGVLMMEITGHKMSDEFNPEPGKYIIMDMNSEHRGSGRKFHCILSATFTEIKDE